MESIPFYQAVVEELYEEALLLADEARAVFDLHGRDAEAGSLDEARVALSIEGLRTTTRVMHVLAWLLNRRAYLSGDLTASQLRRHGALPEERPSDPGQLLLLEPETCALIRETERLHARCARLDHEWGERRAAAVGGIREMQGRLATAFERH